MSVSDTYGGDQQADGDSLLGACHADGCVVATRLGMVV